MENYTETAYQRAYKKVESIKAFYNHVLVYVVINSIPLFIWLFIIRDFYETIENQGFKTWIAINFLFFTGVWSIILLFHGLKVFKGDKFKAFKISVLKKWEERKIKEFMEAEEKLKER